MRIVVLLRCSGLFCAFLAIGIKGIDMAIRKELPMGLCANVRI